MRKKLGKSVSQKSLYGQRFLLKQAPIRLTRVCDAAYRKMRFCYATPPAAAWREKKKKRVALRGSSPAVNVIYTFVDIVDNGHYGYGYILIGYSYTGTMRCLLRQDDN